MKQKRTKIKQMLMAALAALLPFYGAAQQVTVNRVYDFSGGDTVNSEINYVYADSNFIIALGHAQAPGEEPYAFTAAFDYSGNLLWKKPIELPAGLEASDWGYNNLAKTASGLYVAGGNVPNALKADGSRAYRPFLYLFSGQGDSIKLLLLPNDSTFSERLSAVTVNPQGQIIVGGDSWYCIGHTSDTDVVSYPNDSISKLNLWFKALDDSLNILYENKVKVCGMYRSVVTGPNPTVVNIIQTDSSTYLVNGNSNILAKGQLLLRLSSDFSFINILIQGNSHPYDTHLSSPPLLALGMPFESNLIRVKGQAQSYYWSLPAVITENSMPIGMGIYYARAKFNVDSSPPFYHLNWEHAFIYDTAHLPSKTGFPGVVQGRSDMELAINGDVLLQKASGRPSDTLTATPHSSYFLPAVLRVDTGGHTRWGKVFQYIQSTDSGLCHSFNDVSVAPDGRIVMGGYLRSRYPVGAYDTVGTVSWLVVLNDSVHDQDTSTGIVVAPAGKDVIVSVYPNPTIGNTFISLQQFKGNIQDFSWQLLSLDGRVLQTHQMKTTRELVRLNNEAPGIYFLRLFYKGSPSATVKVVKE